jgi:ribonuclease HI
VDKGTGRIGIGIIVRDHEGILLAARSFAKTLVVEPVAAEGLAAFYAVEFSRDMCFNDIILEGDALQIVAAVQTDSQHWSRFGHIVDGIKLGLSQLRSWQINHVKRDANSAAHVLAREAIKNVIDRVWVEETPNCIYGIVLREQFAPV